MHSYRLTARPLRWGAGLLALACAFPTLARAADLKQATVTQAFNDVRVIAPNAADQPANSGARIEGEKGVKTGDKSRAELEFQDKTLTRLGANTIFSFDGGTRAMEMQQGTMLLQVPKNAGGAKIRTAAVTAAITGTTILLEYTPDREVIEGGVKKKKKGKIKVIVLEGQLRLTLNNGSGQTVTLNGGQMLVCDPSTVSLPQPAEVDVSRLISSSLLVNNAFWGQEAAMAAGQTAAQAAAAAAAGAGTNGGRLNLTLINETIAQQQAAIANGTLGPASAILTLLGNEVVLLGTFDPLAQVNQSVTAGNGGPVLPPLPANDGPKNGPLPAVTPGEFLLDPTSIVQLDPVVTTGTARVEGRIYRGAATDGSPVAYAFGETLSRPFDLAFGFSADAFFAPITFPAPGVTFFRFDTLRLAGTPLFVTAGGPTSLVLIGANGIGTASSGTLDFSSLSTVFLATQSGALTLASGFALIGGNGDRLTLYARGNAGDLSQSAQIGGFSQVRAGAERDLTLNGGGSLAAGTRAELVAGRNLTLNGQLAAPNVALTSLGGVLSLSSSALNTAVILDLTATAPSIVLTGSLNAGATASQLRFNAGSGGFNAATFTLAGTARQISVSVTGGGGFAASAFTGNALTLSGGGSIVVTGALDVTTLTFDGPISAGSITAGTINATNATFAGPINAGTVNVGGSGLTLNGGGSGGFNVPAGATLTIGSLNFNLTNVTGAGAVLFTGNGFRDIGGFTLSGPTTVSDGTVRLSGFAAFGPLTLAGGSIQGSGGMNVSGPFLWTSGSITGLGFFNVTGPLTISGTGPKMLGRGLFASGITTLSGADLVGLIPGRIINDGDFRLLDNAGISGLSFTNNGTLTKTGAGTTSTLTSFSNAGIVSVVDGTLRVNAGSSTGGSLTVASGAALELNGFSLQGGSLTGTGLLRLSNFTASGGTLVFAGQTEISSGTATFDSVVALDYLNLAGGTLSGSGDVFANGGLIWTAGGMSGTGTTSVAAIDGLTISGAATKFLAGQRTLLVEVGTSFSGGDLVFSDSALFLNAGIFTATDGAGLTGTSTQGFLNASLGSFVKSGPGTTTNVTVPFTNAGSVQVRGGTLAFQNSFTQTAGSTVLGGGLLSTSGTLAFNAGLLTGSGNIVGNVTSNALIQPSVGVGNTGLAISGNLTLLGGSTLQFALGGLTQGSGYGFVSAGSAALGGNLVLSFANGTENLLTAGSTFTLLTTSGALGGAFVNVPSGSRLTTTDNLGSFLVSYSGSTLTLSNFVFSAVTDAVYLGGTNNWSTAAGWSSNPAVPNNGVRTFNVFVNGGNLTQDIAGGVFVQRLTMSGGTLSLPNALTLNDGLTYSGGTIQNGDLTVVGGTSTAATTLGFSNVNFVLGGTLALNFSGNLFAGSVDFANAATGVLLLSSGANVTLNAASGVSNGAFLVPGGSRLNLLSGFLFSGHAFLGGGDVALNNGQSTTFQALVRNDVTFTLASAGSFTDLLISGAVQLDGAGTLVLGDSARVRGAGSGPATLVNLGNVIRGTSTAGGSLGANDVAFDNRSAGVIEADGSGQALLVDPAPAGGLLNAGILRARNGGVLLLSGAGGGDFVNTSSGLIEAQAGSQVQLRDGASISGGVLGGTGVFRNLNLAALANLSLQATFLGDNGSTTTLTGTIDNRGTLRLNSAGSFTDLILNGTVTLTGGGTVTLGDSGRLRGSGGGVLINVDNTLDGESTAGGSLGAGSVTIVNQALGVIVANVSGRALRLVPDAGGLSNAGTLRALDGGILVLSGTAGGAFDNTGGTIEAQTASEVQFEGATVTGGTLLGAGGVFRNLTSVTLRDLALNGPFVANNGTSTVFGGTLTNNGSVLLQTAGSFTDLFLAGDVTLGGNGTLTLGDSARVRGQLGGEILTNLGNTISGESTAGGSLGSNSIGLLNAAGGTIVANVSGRFLLVDPNAAHGLANQGLLLADNGGFLRLSGAGGGGFDNTGGLIQANNGSEVQFTAGASVVGGTLSGVGSGLFRVLDVAALSDLTLAGNLFANNGSSTTLGGSIANSGTLTVGASGSFTDLFLGGVTLSGGGTVALQDAARLRGAGLFTNLDNRLRGETGNGGSFGANELTIVNEAAGSIDADVSGRALTLDPGVGNLTNRGQLRALGGGILVLTGNGGGDVDNTGGVISAGNGSEVQLTGGVTVVGGTLNSTGTGLFRNLSSAVLGDLTLAGSFVANNGTTTTLFGNVVNLGTISIAAAGSFTDLSMEGPVTLSGGGQIVLQDAARVRSALTGSSLVNVDNTIRGSTPNSGSFGANELALTNQAAGVISADVAGQALVLDPGVAGGFVNRGLLQATGGGVLVLTGNGGGAFDNAGGLVRVFPGSQLQLTAGAAVTGGTLQADPGGLMRVLGTAALADVAWSGQLQVDNGSALTLGGTVGGPSARVVVAAAGAFTDLFFVGASTFDGALRLQDAARVRGSGASPTLTILGTIGGETSNSGSLGTDSLAIVNSATGLIVADVPGLALIIDPSAAGLTNAGILRATAGGNLVLSGNGGGGFANTGAIEISTGSTVTVGGALTSSGSVNVGSGQMVVQSVGSFTQTGGTFQIAGGTVANTAPLVFSGGLLTGHGSVGGPLTNAATIRPAIGLGSTGLAVGSLLLQGSSRLEFTIGGLVQGSGYGFLGASGSVTLGGQIVVAFANGFGASISSGDSFTIMTGSSFSGAFSTALPGGRIFTADGLGSFQFTIAGTSIVLSNFSAAAALAANYAGGTGNWSDPNFWSTNPLVPNNGNGGSTFNVTLGSGTVTQDIGGGVVVQTLTLAGGSIALPAGNTLSVNGLLTWSTNGTVSGTGVLTAAGGATFGGSAFSDLTGGATFVLPAGQTAVQSGTNQIRLGGGANFQNLGSFFAQTNFGITQLAGGGVFANVGTFTRDVQTGISPIGAGLIFNNSGTVNVQTGTLSVEGGGTSAGGAFNVAPGATLAFGAGYTFQAGTSIANTGTVDFRAGNSAVAGTLSGAGIFRFSGGSTTFAASQTVGALDFAGGSISLGSGLSLAIAGPLTWNVSGSFGGGGSLVANGGGTLGGSAFSDLLGGSTLTVPVGQTMVHGGTNEVRLGGGATFQNFGAFDEQTAFGVTPLAGGGSFVNAGTFLRSISTGIAPIGVTFLNSGLVNVTSGILSFNAGGSSTGGIFRAGPGSIVRFASNFAFDAAAQLDGAGTIEFASGTQTFAGTYTGNGTLLVNGGALTLTTNQSLATLQLNAGSLSAAAGRVITINSQLIWNVTTASLTGGATYNANGGVLFGGGAFSDLLGGSTLNLAVGQIAVHNGSNQIRLGGGATLHNAGVFQADTDFGIAAASGSGTFNNSGSFVRANSGNAYAVAVPFANSGTVDVNAGTLRFDGGYSQSGGSLNLNGGNVGGTTLALNGGVLTGFGTIAATLQNGAQITPALVGSGLLVNGNVTLLGASRLNFNLGGLTQGSQYGFLGVNGSVTLGGTLAVVFTGGFQSSVTGANTFTLLTSSSALAGAFANIASGSRLQTTDGFGSFLVTYLGNSLVLSNFISGVATVWTGTTGNWSAGANWSSGTAPNSATLDVSIDAGRNGVASVVNVDGTFAVRDLTLDAGDALSIRSGAALTLNGVLRNDGAITFQSGVASSLNFVNATTLTGTGSITLVSSAALNAPGFTNSAGHTLLGSGTITGSFTNRGTVVANAGTLTFINGFQQDAASGQLTLSGGQISTLSAVVVGAGTVSGFGTISGGLDVGGTLAPANGILNVNSGALTLRSTALLQLTLGGTIGGSQYSVASVSGPVTLGGTLAATFTNGFASGVRNSDIFSFLSTSGSIGGDFANVTSGTRLTTADGAGSFLFTRNVNTLTLTDFLATITNPLAANWLTATSNSWNNAASWSGGVVPNDTAAANGTGYNVTIAATGAPYTVTLSSGAFTVQSLLLNSANATLAFGGVNLRALNGFTLQAGTLTMSGTTLRGPTLALAGGQLAPDSNGSNILDGLAVTGTLNLATNNATLRLRNGANLVGTANLSGSSAILAFEQTRTLSGLTVNLGTASTGGFLSIEATNTLTLDNTVVIRGAGAVGGARLLGGSQTLVNQGSITADVAGQTLAINPNFSFVNTGSVSALGGSILTLGAGGTSTVANSGTVTANNSTVNFLADFTGSGVGTVNATNSTLNLQGQFRTAGLAGINRTGGSVTLSGTLDNSGATFAFSPALGAVALTSGVVSGGTVDGAGNPFLFSSNSSNRFTGVAVINGLTLGQTSSILRLTGGSTLAGSVALSGNGAVLGIEQSGTLDGFSVDLGGAGLTAFFTIESTNTLTLGPGVSIRGAGAIGGARIIGGTSTLTNQGTITADLSGLTLNINANVFTNTGTLGASNGGTLGIGTAATQTYVNNGVIGANNGTLIFSADFTGSGIGTVNAINSTVTLAGNFRTAGLNAIARTGGLLQLTGLVDNTGSTFSLLPGRGIFLLNSGRVLGGTIDNTAGQSFEFAAAGNNRFDGVSVVGGVQLALTGSVLQLINGSQIAGQVTLSGSGANLAINQSATMSLQAVLGTAATQAFVSIEGTNTLTLAAGSLLHGWGGVGGARIFGGTSTLINGGTIEADVPGQTLTVNPNVLINNGTLSSRNGGILTIAGATSFTNNGSIVLDNGTLNLPGAITPALLPSISAVNGSTVNLSGTLDNTGLTTTLPGSAGTFTLAGGTITGGTLNVAPSGGAAALTVTGSSQNILNGVALVGDLTFPAGGTLRLNGGTSLQGNVTLAASSTTLSIEQTFTFAGPLTLNLGSASAGVAIGGGSTVTLGSGVTVRGFGAIGGTVFGGGTNQLINQGTMSADVSGGTLTINPNGLFTNNGLVQASGGGSVTLSTGWTNAGGTFSVGAGSTLNLNGTYSGNGLGTINNSGGTINLGGAFNNVGLTTTLPASAGTFTLNSGTITGGTLNVSPSSGAAALTVTGSSQNFLSGVALVGDLNFPGGGSLRLNGGTSLQGNVTLAASSTTLSIEQTATFAGPLNLNLGSASAGVAIGGGSTVTLGSAVTVRGFGAIGGTVFGGGTNQLINQGTMSADVSGGTLTINPNGLFTNNGLVQASGGGSVTLSTGWTNAGGTLSVGTGSTLNLNGSYSGNGLGTINNSGGTINLGGAFNNVGLTTTLPASAGTFTLNSGTITGGTLNVSPSSGAAALTVTGSSQNFLAGVALVGDLNFPGGGTLRLNGGTSLQGNVTLAASSTTLSLEQTGTFAGPLTLNLGSASAGVAIGGGSTVTLGSGVTVRGFGAIGGTVFGGGTNQLINQGTMSADVSGGTLTINPNGLFTNNGLVQASGGGSVTLSTGWTNAGGTLSVGTGSTLNLNGSYSGNGLGTINNSGGTINLGGAFNNVGLTTTLPASAGTFTLNSGTITGGTLNVSPSSGAAALTVTGSSQNFLTGVALVGDLNFPGGGTLRLNGGTSLQGNVTLAASSTTLSLEQTGTFAGPLALNLGSASASVAVGGNNTVTLGSAVTVRGFGAIGGTVFGGGTNQLVNQGTMSADVAGSTLTINPNGAFTNSGTLNVLNGATLTLATGAASSSTGAIFLTSGTLNLNRPITVASLTGGVGVISIPTANDVTAPNGFAFNGASGTTAADGGTLTLTTPGLTLGTGAGQINGLSANGGDASAGAGGNGGAITVTASSADLVVNANVDATTGATAATTGGNGGSVTLNATGANNGVTVASRVRVSDSTAGRRSSRGGNISINSARSTGTAINITSTAQLHALLDAAAPGPGGTINIVATGTGGSNIAVAGNVRADRGTVQIRHNGAAGTVNVANTASIRADVVKIGALGNNGVLTIAGGLFDADTTIRLYATGSNGQVVFTGNTTLQGTSVKQIAGQTVTIQNGVQVNVLGTGPAQVFTNVPNFTGSGGNGSTTGTFTGQGATTQPLGNAPGF